MNVCIITSTFPTSASDPIGGFAYDFCLTLAKNHHVTVITQKRAEHYETDKEINLRLFNWKGTDIPLAGLKLYRPDHILYMMSLFMNAKKTLDKHVKNDKPDYCFALWALPSGIGAYYINKKYRVPFDVWCLGSDIWKNKNNLFTKPLLLKILKAAKNVYADGYNFCKDIELLSGRACRFLASSRKLNAALPGSQPENKDKKTFIFVGRYHVNKGPDVLVSAIALLPKEINDASEFIFYGKGPLKEQLQNTANRLNLKNISIHDILDKEHIAEAFSQSHFIIIPSRLDSIPVILSDALQCNTPVIGADVGDLGDVIRKQKIGYVFQKENAAELSQAIVKAFHDRKQDYSGNIHEAMKAFSVEHAVSEFESNLH